jgi:hypothetical protein
MPAKAPKGRRSGSAAEPVDIAFGAGIMNDYIFARRAVGAQGIGRGILDRATISMRTGSFMPVSPAEHQVRQ